MEWSRNLTVALLNHVELPPHLASAKVIQGPQQDVEDPLHVSDGVLDRQQL